MAELKDRSWDTKYTPDEGSLVERFYVPALSLGRRYDRSTGYFKASALAVAARGLEHLVQNGGVMRLVVGCTLAAPEVEAIEQGLDLRALVAEKLGNVALQPPDPAAGEALELLAWMVAKGTLDIKVAVPCDSRRRPIPSEGIFHEKAGVIHDAGGNAIAFSGSINETEAGWLHNWESFHVYTSWGGTAEHVRAEEESFERLWADRSPRAVIVDISTAAQEQLLKFLPKSDKPARLDRLDHASDKPKTSEDEEPKPPAAADVAPSLEAPEELRAKVWALIDHAARSPSGDRVGEATSAVTPWPHQVRAFDRMYSQWPPRLLIADEVGLGKTIEAGLVIRQAWLSGKARRILVMTPKAVLKQWQIELREKFNLHWPIYDGSRLVWQPTRGRAGRSRAVARADWHKEPFVLVSSHLMRRRERRAELLEDSEPWDLVVLDEAHHARRRGAGSASEGGANALLSLMRGLRDRCDALVLLTATPMQVHPVELYDLLALLGLPDAWTDSEFVGYFEKLSEPSPGPEAWEVLARLFQSVNDRWGPIDRDSVVPRMPKGTSPLKTRKVLAALTDRSSIRRQMMSTQERRLAMKILRSETPVRYLVSRHTRQLLRRYHKAGRISSRIADRDVRDVFVELTPLERELYEAVENYISHTYDNASEKERNAVGFVMTIYRRRLASSFLALRRTLEKRLAAVRGAEDPGLFTSEDLSDDELRDEAMDDEEASELERQALVREETSDIEALLAWVKQLPVDTKAAELRKVLLELRKDNYQQCIVFTQYTDTLDFLRDELAGAGEWTILCYSGRGGEARGADGRWSPINREETKRRFKAGSADLLLCTDAAAEGLNFQFCGALVNYDMPWNPMRVEQRIGRVDRLGQKFETIRIVNLHYDDTVETDVYRALEQRIQLFRSVVGKLQPILARLPQALGQAALSRDRDRARADVVSQLAGEVDRVQESALDLDEATEGVLDEPTKPEVPVDLASLGELLGFEELLPPGSEASPLDKDWSWTTPGGGRQFG